MNLVNMIESQLSDDVMGKLTQLVGAGQETTQSAVGAAVPALLSGLSSVASSSGGAQRLMAALSKLDGAAPGNWTDMLNNKPDDILGRGSDLLNSVLGGNLVSGLTRTLAQFSGIGSGTVTKLLGYLMPLVLGSIASRFTGKAMTPQGLTSMLADQKANIEEALPSGFSLDSVPGLASAGSALASAGSAVRSTAGEAQRASSALPRWLLPVAGLVVLALVLYFFLRPATPEMKPPPAAIPGTPNPSVPDVSQLTTNLTSSFKSATSSLAGIKDAASAAAAVPKLNQVSDELDQLKTSMDKLPEAGKVNMMEMVKSQLGPLDDQFAKLQWIPGVSDEVKSTINRVLDKFASLGGVQVPQTANVSGELANLFSSLTGTLSGIRDTATAEGALPKLRDIDAKLDASKKEMAQLSESGKSTIASLLKVPLGKLRELMDKIVAIPAVGDKVKPVVDSIVNKLNNLVV